MKTQETTTATPAALVIWNGNTEKQVRDYVNSGASVPKGLMKAAPKGFVAGLRSTRKAELIKQTPVLLGGFQRDGFRIESLGDIKTLKDGSKSVTMKLKTAKPTSALSMAEFAAQCGTTVEAIMETFAK